MNPKNRLAIYNILGGLCQGAGMLAVFWYMSYDMASIQFFMRTRMMQIIRYVYYLNIATIALYTLVQLVRSVMGRCFLNKPQGFNITLPNLFLSTRVKIVHFVNGVGLGALFAPLFLYILDLKFNIH